MIKDKIKEITATITAIGILITTITKQEYLKDILAFVCLKNNFVFYLIILILMVFILYLIIKIFNNKIDLKKHPFFTQMDFYIGYNIRNLELTLEKCRIVFIDLLLLKFNFWKTYCQKLVDDYNTGKIDDSSYYKKWFMNALQEQQIILEKHNIPDIVIKIFNNWHQKKIMSTLSFIDKIIQSNSKDKYIINALLTFLDNSFDETILDAETSISILNGDLTGIEYHRIINNNNEIITL